MQPFAASCQDTSVGGLEGSERLAGVHLGTPPSLTSRAYAWKPSKTPKIFLTRPNSLCLLAGMTGRQPPGEEEENRLPSRT